MDAKKSLVQRKEDFYRLLRIIVGQLLPTASSFFLLILVSKAHSNELIKQYIAMERFLAIGGAGAYLYARIFQAALPNLLSVAAYAVGGVLFPLGIWLGLNIFFITAFLLLGIFLSTMTLRLNKSGKDKVVLIANCLAFISVIVVVALNGEFNFNAQSIILIYILPQLLIITPFVKFKN